MKIKRIILVTIIMIIMFLMLPLKIYAQTFKGKTITVDIPKTMTLISDGENAAFAITESNDSNQYNNSVLLTILSSKNNTLDLLEKIILKYEYYFANKNITIKGNYTKIKNIDAIYVDHKTKGSVNRTYYMLTDNSIIVMLFSTQAPTIDSQDDFSRILNSMRITDKVEYSPIKEDIELTSWNAVRDTVIKIVVLLVIIKIVMSIINKVKNKGKKENKIL